MRSLKLFSLTCSLLYGMLACQPASSNTKETNATGNVTENLHEVFTSINQEVLEHSRAYQSLGEIISKIGHRLSGSENGMAAEEFAYNLFREYGFQDVEYFPFEIEAWFRDSTFLMVTNGGTSGVIFSESLAHSPLEFDDELEWVDVGNGLRNDFEKHKAEIPEKFVLLNLQLDGTDPTAKNLHRTEKTTLAIEYGAAGAVFINTVAEHRLLTGAASATGELIPIPAICITNEGGSMLRKAFKKGFKMHLTMGNHTKKTSARNVIGRIKGSSLPNEKIIIGGHLDSWDLGTGAIDNGIGAFTVLEIARTFKKLNLQPRRTIEFVLYMGEEQGLLGSTAMVKHLKAAQQLDQVRYVINLDMSGNAIGFRSMGHTEMEPWLTQIGSQISVVDKLFPNKVGGKAVLHSDHQPFMLEGVPVLGIWSNLDPNVYQYYHSDGDNYELVDPVHMDNCARFTGMMLYAMANAEELPAKRQTSEETRDFLMEQGLKEKLVLGKDWKWE